MTSTAHRPLLVLLVVSALVPATACIVNNNQSPGANGTVAPTVTMDPNVAVAMPGASAQVTATATGSATVGQHRRH